MLADSITLGVGQFCTNPGLIVICDSDPETEFAIHLGEAMDSLELEPMVHSKINKKYTGVVSGIMERGVFIEVKENKCEGFVRAKDIPGDYFNFLVNEMLLLGRHTKEEYRLGDKVLIKVEAVNQSKKQIDFSLLEKM